MIGWIIMAGTAATGGALVIALWAIGLVISSYKSIRKAIIQVIIISA